MLPYLRGNACVSHVVHQAEHELTAGAGEDEEAGRQHIHTHSGAAHEQEHCAHVSWQEFLHDFVTPLLMHSLTHSVD